MPDNFNDNECIEFPLVDSDCGENHDIRTGGADGSAGEGVYGGPDGSEPIPLDRVNWMRELPCGVLDMKGLRTIFWRLFTIAEDLCSQISNVACRFNITTVAANETIRGILAAVDGPNGCRTTLVDFPEIESVANALPVPVEILNVGRFRADGSFNSGAVTVDLAALPGVTVPAGAKAAILRCGSSCSGQDQPGLGIASLFAHCHIEVASVQGNLNGGNFFSPVSVPTQVTYVDTNIIQGDNDDTNDAIVGLNGTSIAYAAQVRFNDTLGLDFGVARIYLVGFL